MHQGIECNASHSKSGVVFPARPEASGDNQGGADPLCGVALAEEGSECPSVSESHSRESSSGSHGVACVYRAQKEVHCP